MSFFPPPPVKEMSVFTRLPDRYRRRGKSVWAYANRPNENVDSFLEGPAFDHAGRLYVTDIPFGRVFRVETSGEWDLVAEYDGWPNGLKISRDGTIVIADFRHGLMSLDAESGTVTPLVETVNSESFKGINDLVFGGKGEIYFTDQGQTGMHDPTGRVYRLSPDGTLTRLLETGPSPNGIALDPARESLFVAMTRANQIWRIPLHESGIVSKVGVFSNLHGGTAGPDGIAFDEVGNLFVAHAGLGCVWGLSPSAVPFLCLRSVEGTMTTNLAFGGIDRKRLFVTESETGAILVASMEIAGLHL
jgi:gluconolactonase